MGPLKITLPTLLPTEFYAAADRAAAGFQKLGVKPGVNVGLYLPNTPHYLIAFFGVLKAGGIYVPVDVGNPPARASKILQACEPSVVLAGAPAVPLLEGVFKENSFSHPSPSLRIRLSPSYWPFRMFSRLTRSGRVAAASYK